MAIPKGMKVIDGKIYRKVTFGGVSHGTKANAEKVAANIRGHGISARVVKDGNKYQVWRED